jgi:hypothetical protein
MAKKILLWGAMAIFAAAAVTFGVMFFITKADLGDTRTALEGKISLLNEARTELAATQVDLAETNNDLTRKTAELTDTQSKLDEKIAALLSTETELNNTNDKLDKVKSDLAAQEQESLTLKTTNNRLNNDLTTSKNQVTELTRSIDLYKETFGEVFSGVEPFYVVNDTEPPSWSNPGPFIASLRMFHLVNNPKAVNPTYQQVLDFIQADKTDSNRYVDDYYMCGNFAETVHNNAEAAGIRTAMVFIRFRHGPGHAIVAFLTTDKGLVYIDSTGAEFQAWASLDCSVKEMKIGKIYTPVLLFTSAYYIIYDTDNPITDIEVYW